MKRAFWAGEEQIQKPMAPRYMLHASGSKVVPGPLARAARGCWGLELFDQRFLMFAMVQFNVSVFLPANWIIHKNLMYNVMCNQEKCSEMVEMFRS